MLRLSIFLSPLLFIHRFLFFLRLIHLLFFVGFHYRCCLLCIYICTMFFHFTLAVCSSLPDMSADRQLHLHMEYGGIDLHPQATSSNNSLGTTSVLWTRKGMSSFIFHPNMERLVTGVHSDQLLSSKCLKTGTFDMLFCRLVSGREAHDLWRVFFLAK